MSSTNPFADPSATQEFLSFRRMLTPVIIQVVFWIGIAAIAIGVLGLFASESAGTGLLLLIFGPITWRVYTELLIVIFRIHSGLEQANDSLRAIAAGGDGQIPLPPQA